MSKFSILLCCFGDYPHFAQRALVNIIAARNSSPFPVHVGMNDCGMITTNYLRGLYDAGSIDTLIESRSNINKDPMMRLLLDRTQTEYIVWLDDDSYFGPDWHKELCRFIDSSGRFDVAGKLATCARTPAYERFLTARPWYVDSSRFSTDTKHVSRFALGGLFVARTAFLREHNFPDKAMVKKHDDMLLGDLVEQQRGKLVPFSHELREQVFEDKGERRGSGEQEKDFLTVSPITVEEAGGQPRIRKGEHLQLQDEAYRLAANGLLEEALQRYLLALQ
ncbi:MAG: hypothetical protein J5J00_04810, partial [Deltaproteobacteria bacterium]|nr:hypothetical protein [Deltaproteobacteria bacterium]